jgi:hypothetical protein
VYFSDKWADVNSGAPAADRGSTGDTASYFVSSLVKGLTYYWRIDTASEATTYRGNIWNFTTKPVTAYYPSPDTGASNAAVDPLLSWQAGSGAVQGHVVIFGDSFNQVNSALTGTTGTSPPYRKYITDVTDTNCTPIETGHPALDVSTTYYWRVDEVESLSNIHQGTVWSFTTVPVPGLGSILCELYTGIPGGAVSDLTSNANYPDNPDITEYLPAFEAPGRGLHEYGSRVHGWLYIRKSGDYTFWIASGEQSQLWLSTDNTPENVSIIAYVDALESRDGWTDPRQWDKYPEIQKSAPIYLEAGNLYYIMVLHKKGWGYDSLAVAWEGPDQPNPPVNGEAGAIIPGTSLIPFERETSYNSDPANGATDVKRESTLSWTPGPYAVTHNIYFGTDFNSVSDVNTTNLPSYPDVTFTNVDVNYYKPGFLDYKTTYYWRVDDVNDVNIWKGSVWSFTVGDYLTVDDFEDYNDFTPYKIFQTWKDGFGTSDPEYHGNGTGSAVGSDAPPWAEQVIVNNGRRSMPVHYDNSGTGTNTFGEPTTLLYSEIFRQWDEPQDWTREDVKSLALWFRGYPATKGSYTLNTGTFTVKADGADIWDTADAFHFVYQQLTADFVYIEAKVVSITNTAADAKAGVMIRDSLDADSTNAFMCLRRDGSWSFQARTEYKDSTLDATSDANTITLPYWVRLLRESNAFTASYSSDGINWDIVPTQDENSEFPNPQGVPMTGPVYIGLAYTSSITGTLGRAVFSNVSINGVPFQPTGSRDVPSNDAALLYIAVEDSSNNIKVINHPDNPNAVQLDEWTEWPIDLAEISGANVDLKNIKKMYIGVGDRDNPVTGGFGKLYIDDIRLHIPRCVSEQAKPAGDFDDNCVVDYLDLQIMTDNWLISEYDVTPIAPIDANLMAYYAFENNLLDGSGNGNNGDPCGAPTYVAGKIGKAIQLNGGDGVVTGKSLLNDLSEFTLASWVSAGNTDASRVALFGQNDCIEFGFDSGDIHVWTSGGGEIRTGWERPELTWHHIAVVGDGEGLAIYVDGQSVVTGGSAISEDSYGSSTYGFNIGTGVFDATGNWLNGQVDEVRVYSRALSQDEIAWLAGKTAPFTQPLYQLLTPQDTAIDMDSDGKINLKDYALLVDIWLEEQLWP